MKRTTLYVLFTVLAAVAVAAVLGWLTGTNEGARWLLDAVSRHTRLKVATRNVEGRFLDHLRLSGVRLTLPQQNVEFESFELHWKPLLLLAGEVAVTELTVRGARIQNNIPAGKEPTDLSWPKISGLPAWLDGRLDRLQVDGFTYRHLDGEPVCVSKIAGSMTWRKRFLSFDEFTLVSPSGRVAGSVMAGFRRPSLRLDLAVTPAQPLAEMDILSVQARLLPGKRPEQLAGKVTVTGKSASKQRLELAGEIGMTRDSFNFRQLLMTAPGRPGMVTGEGTLLLAAQEPILKLKMKAADLDLALELNVPTRISGELTFDGTPAGYRGEFELFNSRGQWSAARISGRYEGNATGMKLAPLSGSLLDGAVQGSLEVGWRDGISLIGSFHGRNLNPARVSPDWKGEVNFDLTGSMTGSESAPLRGKVRANLLESRLHGRALTGRVQADFADGNVRIDRLTLQGKGFSIGAAGELNKRLDFSARVSDLAGLIPGTAGKLRTAGWMRWRGERLSGVVTGRGSDLAAEGLQIAAAELDARVGGEEKGSVQVTAGLRNLGYKQFRTDSATLEVTGTSLRHRVKAKLHSAGAEARLALAGGYSRGSWRGEITQLAGRDSIGSWGIGLPAALTISAGAISLSPLVVTGAQAESLVIAGDLARTPLRGTIRLEWGDVNLGRANRWLKDVSMAGLSSGSVRLRIQPVERLVLSGKVKASGTVTAAGQSITVRHGLLDLTGDEHGIRASMEITLAEGGMLMGTIVSAAPASLAVPEEGNVVLEWKEIDLEKFRSWLPRDIRLEGRIAGRITGKLLPGSRLDVRGDATLSKGKGQWQRPGGVLNATLRNAQASWRWRGESLSGTIALSLAEHGLLRGDFQLPLPARLSTAIDPQGAVRASLTGRLREQGVLTAIFPGLVRESHGGLDVNLKVGGRWEEPLFEGDLRLAKAGAYLPTAGIHVKEVQLTMRLEKDLIRIDSFRAVSGPGRIEGTAVIRLDGGRVAEYRGSISGERFQVVYLPELQLLATPRLKFEGTAERVTVRGDVRLPELIATGPPGRDTVKPSRDVVIEGTQPAGKTTPFDLDIQVRVEFGDRVLVKVEGIDAQLAGSVDLAFLSLNKVTSRGEIRVAKGRYKTYGVDLEIVRGRLFYAGGPVERPTMDILALRTIGDIRAGVTVKGNLQAPVVELYSEPPMPDVDILSYVVIGRPFGAGDEKINLMAQAAGLLLSTGQSVVLQDQIRNRLGLSTLEIKTGAGEATGHMGYKPVQVTPPGAEATGPATSTSQTILTVGKYLTPKLYLSYGQSLFTGNNLIRLRYDIFKNWEVETLTGAESGIDIYYKIDFE